MGWVVARHGAEVRSGPGTRVWLGEPAGEASAARSRGMRCRRLMVMEVVWGVGHGPIGFLGVSRRMRRRWPIWQCGQTGGSVDRGLGVLSSAEAASGWEAA